MAKNKQEKTNFFTNHSLKKLKSLILQKSAHNPMMKLYVKNCQH